MVVHLGRGFRGNESYIPAQPYSLKYDFYNWKKFRVSQKSTDYEGHSPRVFFVNFIKSSYNYREHVKTCCRRKKKIVFLPNVSKKRTDLFFKFYPYFFIKYAIERAEFSHTGTSFCKFPHVLMCCLSADRDSGF